jgi:hypothetical protein
MHLRYWNLLEFFLILRGIMLNKACCPNGKCCCKSDILSLVFLFLLPVNGCRDGRDFSRSYSD